MRGLAKQTGAQQKRIRTKLNKVIASASRPEYRIVARDSFMSLKDFSPRQTSKGVSSAPWKKRRVFHGTFFGPGGHVFRRLGKDRLPLDRLHGPAIPRELLRGETRSEIDAVIAEQLPIRMAHEITRALDQNRKSKGRR